MKKTLSNKEIRELNSDIEKYNFQFDKKDLVEKEDDYIKKDGETMFFYKEGSLVPSLKLINQGVASLKKITVDMGAVKFVVNGADIMRPGITHIEDGVLEGELVEIIDENNKKALAIGKVLFDTETLRGMETGKVVESVHFVGDEIWNG